MSAKNNIVRLEWLRGVFVVLNLIVMWRLIVYQNVSLVEYYCLSFMAMLPLMVVFYLGRKYFILPVWEKYETNETLVFNLRMKMVFIMSDIIFLLIAILFMGQMWLVKFLKPEMWLIHYLYAISLLSISFVLMSRWSTLLLSLDDYPLVSYLKIVFLGLLFYYVFTLFVWNNLIS